MLQWTNLHRLQMLLFNDFFVSVLFVCELRYN